MDKRNLTTKILTITGSGLVWLPVLAPLLFGVLHLIRARRLLVDYLMPAELFPAVLVGGALLIWAAVRMRSRRFLLIAGGLAAAVVLLIGGQALAVVTGLASGETEPSGWVWGVVLGALILYDASVVAIGVGGVLLLGELFGRSRFPKAAAS